MAILDTQTHHSFERFVTQTEQALDAVVDTGSDQQLFIASYLHGHFSLVSAQLVTAGCFDLDELDLTLNSSLQRAFADNELEEADQHEVVALWSQLKSNAKKWQVWQ